MYTSESIKTQMCISTCSLHSILNVKALYCKYCVPQILVDTFTCQEAESEQHCHPGAAVLPVVGSEEESQGEAGRRQREEQAAALQQAGEQVHVGPGGGGRHRHGQAGVHILQVGPDMRLTEVILLRKYWLSGALKLELTI